MAPDSIKDKPCSMKGLLWMAFSAMGAMTLGPIIVFLTTTWFLVENIIKLTDETMDNAKQ